MIIGVYLLLWGHFGAHFSLIESDIAFEAVLASVNKYDINEDLARKAHEAVHMSDYTHGYKTQEYKTMVDEVAKTADLQKKKTTEFYHDKIDSLLDTYARKLAQWYNDYNRNQASVPSWLITGSANYPVKKHERKMNREATLWSEYEKIQGLIDKIKSVGTGGVDLADPEAMDILTEKLSKQKALHEKMKKLNAYWKKHNTFIGCDILSESEAEKMTRATAKTLEKFPYFGKPFPDFELTSVRNKIKRTEERIETLKKRREQSQNGDNNQTFEGGTIVRNYEVDRLQILFDAKPNEDIRTILKSNGFRYAPSNKAWQRKLTPNAEYALKKVLKACCEE